jgi:hypothetical protein
VSAARPGIKNEVGADMRRKVLPPLQRLGMVDINEKGVSELAGIPSHPRDRDGVIYPEKGRTPHWSKGADIL